MADWDRNSRKLAANLTAVLWQERDAFRARCLPTLELMREWHERIMDGLAPDNPDYVGAYRGEPGVEHNVRVGRHLGTPYAHVLAELIKFETKLQRGIEILDKQIKPCDIPDMPNRRMVIELAAWAYFEWVRIHPFINGNGRTARLWVNAIAMRYNLPPRLTLRPRPGGGYDTKAAEAMAGGRWQDFVPVLQGYYSDLIDLT